MTGVEQVWNYRFPGIHMPIATFCRRVAEIAERNGCTVETWEEDGLGEASGLSMRLASGRTILLYELHYLIMHHRTDGPTAYIDARELAKLGVQALLEEILTSLGLSQRDVDWVAPPENQAIALDAVRKLASRLPPPPCLGPADSYFHAVWFGASEDEPVEHYAELDADRYSIRCVRKYRDGRLDACSYASDNWRDEMSEGLFPPIAEINRDPEFSAKEISKSEFEAAWSQANRSA